MKKISLHNFLIKIILTAFLAAGMGTLYSAKGEMHEQIRSTERIATPEPILRNMSTEEFKTYKEEHSEIYKPQLPPRPEPKPSATDKSKNPPPSSLATVIPAKTKFTNISARPLGVPKLLAPESTGKEASKAIPAPLPRSDQKPELDEGYTAPEESKPIVKTSEELKKEAEEHAAEKEASAKETTEAFDKGAEELKKGILAQPLGEGDLTTSIARREGALETSRKELSKEITPEKITAYLNESINAKETIDKAINANKADGKKSDLEKSVVDITLSNHLDEVRKKEAPLLDISAKEAAIKKEIAEKEAALKKDSAKNKEAKKKELAQFKEEKKKELTKFKETAKAIEKAAKKKAAETKKTLMLFKKETVALEKEQKALTQKNNNAAAKRIKKEIKNKKDKIADNKKEIAFLEKLTRKPGTDIQRLSRLNLIDEYEKANKSIQQGIKASVENKKTSEEKAAEKELEKQISDKKLEQKKLARTIVHLGYITTK